MGSQLLLLNIYLLSLHYHHPVSFNSIWHADESGSLNNLRIDQAAEVMWCRMSWKMYMYTGRKISASLSYVTVRGEGKMERARGEQDSLCAIASSPSPYLGWLATTCVFVAVNEARRCLATSIRWIVKYEKGSAHYYFKVGVPHWYSPGTTEGRETWVRSFAQNWHWLLWEHMLYAPIRCLNYDMSYDFIAVANASVCANRALKLEKYKLNVLPYNTTVAYCYYWYWY
jgi:hypothetical protein